MFVESSVLMNVKADEYVAVFGVAREGETLADCSKKMAATVKAFADELKTLGIGGDDVFVDFIAQYEKLLGIKLQPPAQVYAQKFAVHYPTDLYDSYRAFESEEIHGRNDRDRYTVQSARKSTPSSSTASMAMVSMQ